MLHIPSCRKNFPNRLTVDQGLMKDACRYSVECWLGYHAADYIMGGYSLWGPLIENLADLGYEVHT